MKVKNIVALVLIAGFASLLFLNFGEQVGGYMDFTQATETGSSAHVVGYWEEDQQYAYDPARNIFTFHMRDEAGTVRQVQYSNPKPANFEDAEKLVIEGKMRGDVFVAEHILVKCPSKYNDARGLEEVQNVAL